MGLAWLGVPEGVAGLRRAIESAREAGSRAVELSAAAAIAMTSAMLGDVASARQLLDWLDRHLPPDAELAFDATVTRALAATYDGDFATARRLIEAALANQLLEHDMGAATTASLIGFWTGDLALVEASLTRLEAHPPFGAFDGMVAWVRAERALLAGDSATALRELSLESSAEALGNLALWQDYNRAELELAEGDPAAARARLTRLAPRIDGSELHYVCACVELLRAELERIAGEPAAAEALAHAALARAVERGMGLVACAALEGLALIAADAGSEASAGRLLGAAEAFRGRTGFSWRYPAERAALEALRPRLDPAALAEGAALSLADAAAWARRGRGERGRPSRGWSSLSPTEQRVVELVAEGLANKEIAARLFVSVATVKTHLQHVYAKVGVRSRAELAAAAVRRGS
jgi:DNA-binding CsgD family transcriptional regulator